MAASDTIRLAQRLGWLDPRQVAATTAALARWGPTLAALYGAAAVRHGGRAAIVDDQGPVTFRELDQASSRLAHGLRSLGLSGGDHVGVLCFNHREFVEVSIATAKAGLTCVYLNTGFASPQLGEVLRREGIRAVVCDDDLLSIVDGADFEGDVIAVGGDRTTGAAPAPIDRRRPERRRVTPAAPESAHLAGAVDIGHDRHTEGGQAQRPTGRARLRDRGARSNSLSVG